MGNRASHVLVAAVVVAAWVAVAGCSESSTGLCGDGEALAFSGESYCVYGTTAAITEEGFRCPMSLPRRFDIDDLVVCGEDGDPPPGFEDHIRSRYDREIDAGVLGDGGVPVDAGGAFESFRRSTAGGPCAPGVDCEGYVELLADGSLRVDHLGELPVQLHEATVTPAELDAAIAVLTDPALVSLLDLGRAPCEPPTDFSESMTLVEGGTTHENSVTACDHAPLAAVRATLEALVATYAPAPS